MAEAKSEPEGARQLLAHWGDSAGIDQHFVDELLCQFVNERAYITFGQVRLPLSADMTEGKVEIRPVARLIVTTESLNKMLAVLNRAAESHSEKAK